MEHTFPYFLHDHINQSINASLCNSVIKSINLHATLPCLNTYWTAANGILMDLNTMNKGITKQRVLSIYLLPQKYTVYY